MKSWWLVLIRILLPFYGRKTETRSRHEWRLRNIEERREAAEPAALRAEWATQIEVAQKLLEQVYDYRGHDYWKSAVAEILRLPESLPERHTLASALTNLSLNDGWGRDEIEEIHRAFGSKMNARGYELAARAWIKRDQLDDPMFLIFGKIHGSRPLEAIEYASKSGDADLVMIAAKLCGVLVRSGYCWWEIRNAIRVTLATVKQLPVCEDRIQMLIRLGEVSSLSGDDSNKSATQEVFTAILEHTEEDVRRMLNRLLSVGHGDICWTEWDDVVAGHFWGTYSWDVKGFKLRLADIPLLEAMIERKAEAGQLDDATKMALRLSKDHPLRREIFSRGLNQALEKKYRQKAERYAELLGQRLSSEQLLAMVK